MKQIAKKNIRVCLICGKEYYRRGTRKFATCSRECRRHYIVNLQTGKKRGPNKKSKGEVIHKDRRGQYKKCLMCPKEFYVHPKGLGRKKYCSMKCRTSDKNFFDFLRGKNNYAWKGGKTKSGEYIYVKSPNHPNRNKGGYVFEHRLIMEKKLGRYLERNEEVHHVNQNKSDNRIENLELVLSKAHFGIVKCPHCLENFKLK